MLTSTRDHPAAPSRPDYNRRFVWLVATIAAFGGLLFGYDWVVIGGAKPFYEKFFNLTSPDQQGWAMSCALIGSLVGALGAGVAAERWGRKRMLIVAAVLFAASSVATGLAGTFAQFIAWRIAGGAAIGLASGLSPLYIAEIAPAAVRGRLVSLNQLTIVIGILAAQVVNLFIAEPVPAGATAAEILASWNGQTGWRWMFGVTAVPSLLFLLGACFVPESPRWLAKTGRTDAARRVLTRIAGAEGAAVELAAIEATLRQNSARVDWRELFTPKVRRLLGLGIVLAVFQQWCGINVVFNYAEEVFSAAGYSVSDILLNIVITGSVNLVFTFVALATVDRWGRRKLMLFGAGALAVVYVVLGAGYALHSQGVHMLGLVLLAIGCYAMSLAPVTWVVISETFPNRVRGLAMSIAVGCLWVACFVLTYTFPLLNRAVGAAGTFWIYAAVCALGFAFVFFRLPETKGRSLEEIEQP
ncbi:sugar porter family MFS transporter [Opitutus sp. ER46]|uniref:sugar porter family MFS transporter n=1 Tax=Opitutus sp. ER46 TaxID=2161864 RepID=UPI000D2F7C12|nr:sugar porter family MFS transporter [Opitutus sp. ER46]PTY01143.1 MFS transporter [Opitutus sp. ER46]